MKDENRIGMLLETLYNDTGDAQSAKALIGKILEQHRSSLEQNGAVRSAARENRLSERDVFLITYGNTFQGRAGEPPLKALQEFSREQLSDFVSYIHVLPFFPYSSDDGFSVMDYRRVNPDLGDWQDIQALGRDFKLAFDLVINHASAQGVWFLGFLRGDPEYRGWFITRPEDFDASRVIRPRTHPLLTPYTRADGSLIHVWTTFSADQADLDFSNPKVLAEMLDVFLGYVERGARIIRIDAIAYLWKEDGHSCLHHPKTHSVVKLFRAVVDALNLDVLLLSETNVPHDENISYFGEGDEAHMVYNFALPPLVLHAFTKGDVGCLSSWARNLHAQDGGLFLNFLASHDGIGLTPARGLVDETAFKTTLDNLVRRGCLISYKATPKGPVPYELNASWFDAVSDPALPESLRVKAHLASHAIAAVLDGMPAVYIHSVLGTPNWTEGPVLKGYNRAINRRNLRLEEVGTELGLPNSRASRCLEGMKALYGSRKLEPALSPGTPSRVISQEGPVFILLRGEPGARLLCAVNVSPKPTQLKVPLDLVPAGYAYDPTSGIKIASSGTSKQVVLDLEPYGVLWQAYT